MFISTCNGEDGNSTADDNAEITNDNDVTFGGATITAQSVESEDRICDTSSTSSSLQAVDCDKSNTEVHNVIADDMEEEDGERSSSSSLSSADDDDGDDDEDDSDASQRTTIIKMTGGDLGRQAVSNAATVAADSTTSPPPDVIMHHNVCKRKGSRRGRQRRRRSSTTMGVNAMTATTAIVGEGETLTGTTAVVGHSSTGSHAEAVTAAITCTNGTDGNAKEDGGRQSKMLQSQQVSKFGALVAKPPFEYYFVRVHD